MEYVPTFRPLVEIARYEPKVEGVEFGLPHLDKLTGGLRPSKLNLVVGYSHHGKTSLMLRALIYNIKTFGHPCLFISGDDTDDMLLCKIIAMMEDIPTEQVESNGPEWREEYVEYNLKRSLVIAATRDEYHADTLKGIYEEAAYHLTEINGEPTQPKIVGFDYLSILKSGNGFGDGGFVNIKQNCYIIKRVARDHPDSVWMVGHQCRKSAADATALTLNDLEYGGHQQADGVIIGCRRNNLATMDDDQIREENLVPKVWVSVLKNKVTGRKSANPIGHPFVLDPISGYIRETRDSDRPYKIGQPIEPQYTYNDGQV